MIIDVWMQHPTLRFLGHDMFESLRRWVGPLPEEPPPIDATIAAMDDAGVDYGLLSAWSLGFARVPERDHSVKGDQRLVLRPRTLRPRLSGSRD